MNFNSKLKPLFVKIMRITLSQIFIMIALSGFVFAKPGNAQEVLNSSLNIELTNATLKEALSQIERQANVKFAYSKESVQSGKLINLKVVNEKLSDVLDQILKPYSLEYEIISGRIVIKRKEKALINNPAKPEMKITGVVTGDAGETLPGVSVVVKGTAIGTVTDVEGKYSLTVPDESEFLTFSFIGYQTEDVAIGGRTQINIALLPDIKALQEVVVVGYGSQHKKDVTGVVANVDAKAFNKGAIVSPDQLIVGKVAGVNIVPSSGEPGSGVSVRIRGGTSINASNEPLFVVDGFPVASDGTNAGRNPLNFINPNDIESFNVLKDASAAAIYGSRGANGVIIITTKRGKKGTPKVTYDGYFSSGRVAKKYDVFDADQFREVIATTANQNLSKLSSDKTINTDWQDQIFRTAVGYSHSLTVEGGSDNTKYRLSVGSLNQDGIVKTSYTKKNNFALGMDQNFFDNDLNIKLNVKGALTEDRFSPGVIGAALNFDPTKPVYDANSPYGGYYEWRVADGSPELNSPDNPVAQLNLVNDIGRNFRGLGNVQIDYNIRPIPGLKANLNLGYDLSRGERKEFRPSFMKRQILDSGTIRYRNPERNSKLLEAFLTYGRTIDEIQSRFEIVGGYSWQNFYFAEPDFLTTKLASNNFGFNNPAVGRLTVARSTRAVENRLISFFGRANYSFKERYNLSFVLRRDGSTRFGPKNKWGLFPSLGLGWSVIDENFMAAFKNVISNLKFRAGYGITGNQGIGDFLYLPTYQQSDQYTQYQFGNEFYSTVRPSGYDENLKWEETTSLNLGLEFGLFDDKISGSFDYYEKNTNDLLFKRAVAAGANLTDILTTNVGKLRNRGVELSLSAIPVQTKKLKWTVGFNIARNKNQILALDGSDDPAFKGYQTGDISGGVGNTIQILKVGQPVNSFYVYKHKKDANGNPISDDFGRATLSDMYEDVSGPSQEKDGVVNENDRQPYKNPAAKYLYGLTSQVNFMNFDLNFTIRGSIGNYVYNNVASNQANYQRGGDNFVPNNMLTSVLETNFYAPQYFSDYYVEDASFLRMDNVSLGYSLKPFSQKMNFRIYGTIQNAFIITKYSGLDPEATISGIDNNIYPRSRTFIVGISVGL